MESWIRESSLYQEWHQEAEQRGREQVRLEIAHCLLDQGIPLETIALATKLSIEQLQQLRQN